MDAIKEFYTEDGDVLKIYYDSSCESPRDWDNLAQMIFTGAHQHTGDKHTLPFNLQEYNSRWDFIEKGEQEIRKAFKDVAIVKPVHIYDHSGISISTSNGYPYNCRWDSGTIGFAIVTKKAIRENWNIRRVTKEFIEQADRILEGEIKTLNDYISGNVYGFVHEDKDENHLDSCWGFYGDDLTTNGILDYVDEKFHDDIKED
jgi:hypothetical protein